MNKRSMPLALPGIPGTADTEWVALPGGELEGQRPSALCAACRARQRAGRRPGTPRALQGSGGAASPVLCFACHRATVERERSLLAAGSLVTASAARFQAQLPFEPVNRPRLERLRAERMAARMAARAGNGRFVDRRRQAQIAARHTLERIVAGVRASIERRPEHEREDARRHALGAAELQLPEAWLPFVASR